MKGQLGFFDLADRYAQFSKSGDPLEQVSATVDFEPFRYRLLKVLNGLAVRMMAARPTIRY